MILRPRHLLLRTLATVLVLLQVAFSGLGALTHTSDGPGSGVTIAATGSQTSTAFHDELRCPLCQFAAQQAQPVPVCDVVTCVTVQNAPLVTTAPPHADLPPHFAPSWRAPPVSFS
jgi:hypothetical protein